MNIINLKCGKIIRIDTDKHNNTLYCAKDVCDILGYGNARSAIDRHCINKVKCIAKTESGIQTMNFINLENVKRLISSCKLKNVDSIAEEFGVNVYDFNIKRKEIEFVECILKSFKDEHIKCQFSIDRYYIDLYFIDYKLAVEFDELPHEYKLDDDLSRQIYIENILKCKFIRVCETDNIFEIINKIFKYIKNSL